MNELITVIVPLYNNCSQIERCIMSIAMQTYSNLQILIIDDGSTDGSSEICDALAKTDTRIEIIHQTNGGVSAARNTGLRKMRGAWMAFVDADDFISPYYIEDLLTATQDKCDIAICNHIWVQDSDGKIEVPFHRISSTEIITGREASIRHFSMQIGRAHV